MNVFLCRLKTGGRDSPNRIPEALERNEVWIGWDVCHLLKVRGTYEEVLRSARKEFHRKSSAPKQISLFLRAPRKRDLVVVAKEGGREFYVGRMQKRDAECMRVPWEKSKLPGRRIVWLNKKVAWPTSSAPAAIRKGIHKNCTFDQFEMDDSLASWAERITGHARESGSAEVGIRAGAWNRGGGGGYQHDVEVRTAIEQHAMRKARGYLESRGWGDIQDTSSRNPYDFLCRTGRTRLYVEVKGASGDGSSFPITAREKRHLESHVGASLVLVVHSIRVSRGKGPGVRGGRVRVWPARKFLDVAKFRPTQYIVKLPR